MIEITTKTRKIEIYIELYFKYILSLLYSLKSIYKYKLYDYPYKQLMIFPDISSSGQWAWSWEYRSTSRMSELPYIFLM